MTHKIAKNIATFSLVAILGTTSLNSAANAEYINYQNPESTTAISFPEELFSWEESLPAHQNGKLFTSEDGGSLAVFSYDNEAGLSPKIIAQSVKDNTGNDLNITYERVTNNWMVQSGYQGDDIYYQRVELSPSGRIHGMLLKYPVALRTKYDRHIGKIARSLTGS